MENLSLSKNVVMKFGAHRNDVIQATLILEKSPFMGHEEWPKHIPYPEFVYTFLWGDYPPVPSMDPIILDIKHFFSMEELKSYDWDGYFRNDFMKRNVHITFDID